MAILLSVPTCLATDLISIVVYIYLYCTLEIFHLELFVVKVI